jgi:hypothetical protein
VSQNEASITSATDPVDIPKDASGEDPSVEVSDLLQHLEASMDQEIDRIRSFYREKRTPIFHSLDTSNSQ